MSRHMTVTVPERHTEDVLAVLIGKDHLENVTVITQNGVSHLKCVLPAGKAGFVLHHLDKAGVGVAFGEVAIWPATIVLPRRRAGGARESLHAALKLLKGEDATLTQRMAVEETYASILAGAELNGDYAMLIICAAIIATTGLATNNNIMIVASMLVSPLMGPILAFTFASNTRNWPLLRLSLLTEGVGIVLTFLVALLFGWLLCINDYVPEAFSWPTGEMATRGMAQNLVAGCVYAVPSGVAVALSATNPNVGATVGVAIAASLLPPICNTGLTLGYAALAGGDSSTQQEYVRIGLMSLALFAANVGLIYLAAMVTFWVRGVERLVRPRLSSYTPLSGGSSSGFGTAGGGSGFGTSGARSEHSMEVKEAAALGLVPVDASGVSLNDGVQQATRSWLAKARKGPPSAASLAVDGDGAPPPSTSV